MSGWRDISTAPKDGKFIDLWVIDSSGDGYRIADCYWKTPRGEYDEKHEGWYGRPAGGDFFCFLEPSWRLTHWMPLPTPPSTQEATQAAPPLSTRSE